MFKQLTLEQRYVISALLKRNVGAKEIAKEIGVSVSTVYREIRRNKNSRGGYSPKLAHEMAMERRERIVRNSALKPDVLKNALKLLVEEQWSPRQISGHMRLRGERISHERIYQEIRADKTGVLASNTRHGMKHRKRTVVGGGVKNIPNRKSIHERPPEADGKRFGDWEMDLIVDPKQKAILTLVERSVNFIIIKKLPEGKKAKPLAETAVRLLAPWRRGVLTITTDNGGEFAEHEMITKGLHRKSMPDVPVFFADPYSSWQKGAVENANGLIRQYIPKGADFDQFTDEDIAEIQRKLNLRPREKLGFLTPIAMFNKYFS